MNATEVTTGWPFIYAIRVACGSGRLHALGEDGATLCGAEVDAEPAGCVCPECTDQDEEVMARRRKDPAMTITDSQIRQIAHQIRAGERVDLDALRAASRFVAAQYARDVRGLVTSIEDHIDDDCSAGLREEIATQAEDLAARLGEIVDIDISHVRDGETGAGGWDVDVQIVLESGETVDGEATLQVGRSDGRPHAWGSIDHWLTHEIVAYVATRGGLKQSILDRIEHAAREAIEASEEAEAGVERADDQAAHRGAWGSDVNADETVD
jgi:hypothetical protein